MKNNKTVYLTSMAMLIGVQLVLMMTPLGYIPIGPIKATTMHIPVIIGGLLLGRKAGAQLGLVFGLTSIFMSTVFPTVTSFIFSPFYAVGEISGNFNSVIIAIVPRVLLGYLTGVFAEYVRVNKKRETVKLSVISFGMTLMHTLMVMAGIYFFFGREYATINGISYDLLWKLIGGVIVTNGIMEAILAGVVCPSVTLAIRKVRRIEG
ncbi:MAG: ECF transporter S component [Erysipelotrichaceae bacterium]|nr:ECF transporter S component [Erysipelotrichaceae bacterium]